MDHRHIDRIKLLSARFPELKGLRVALTGFCLALVVGGYLLVAGQPTNNGAMGALAASCVPLFAVMPRLNRYYADHFGRQVVKRTPAWYVLLFVATYWVLGAYLNARYPEIPPGAPTVVTVALGSIAVAIRDWPWRAYYLGVTAVTVVGFLMTASGGGPLAPNLTVGILFVLIGVSMVPVGVLDHLLLVKLMKESRAPLAAPTADPRV